MVKPTTSIQFGVSFSVKQCRGLRIDAKETLQWLLQDAGIRRFRLMSYWDEHERQPGEYDFSLLDWQIGRVREAGGVVTLCLGARQPRWPENHWPDWAWKASKEVRTGALLKYIETVVQRYKNEACIVSYQLENEALLEAFGLRPEVDRTRLRAEFNLIKRLDPQKPVIMTTSTSWGVPVRNPIPDIVGFSYYRIVHGKNGYSKAFHTPLLHKTRKLLIHQLLNRSVFIHELQCEPWGPQGIQDMEYDEQDKSMSPAIIKRNIQLAKRVKAYPIDLWGAEWWYLRHKQGDDSIWNAVKQSITT
jgi:hypothetical protein